MFSKRLKRLFVTDDDVKDDIVKSKIPDTVDMRNRIIRRHSTTYYHYTYQEEVDGIVHCKCGEYDSGSDGWRSDIKLHEVHTKNDHVDGRCVKCADREDRDECFNFREGSIAFVEFTKDDAIKHTNIMEMLGNVGGRVKCICGNTFEVGDERLINYKRSWDNSCCKLVVKTFESEYNKYLSNKKKQEWESKHGKLNHED